LEECCTLRGCATGDAKLTDGYLLPALHVIHTVGPVWEGGGHNEDALLSSCYRNSLALARNHSLKTIAFPSISTGIYAFPVDRAARIALREISDFVETNAIPHKVVMVCFDSATLGAYRTAAAARLGSDWDNE
jgi:O-acetyl-ADP-ribose deacetylase (regulator of RNase III)